MVQRLSLMLLLASLLTLARSSPLVQCASNVTGLPTKMRVNITFALSPTDPSGPTSFGLRVCYDTKWPTGGGGFPLDCMNFPDAANNRFTDCVGAIATGSVFEFDAAASYVIAHARGFGGSKEWWGKLDLQANTWPKTWSTCNSFSYGP